MLHLRCTVDGEEKIVSLSGAEICVGRSSDNDVVLPDYSVSRRHAVVRPDAGGWAIFDLKSTNGIQLNEAVVEQGPLQPGDRLRIGIFELTVEQAAEETTHADPTPPTVPLVPSPVRRQPSIAVPVSSLADISGEAAINNATIVRSLAAFTAEYGLGGAEAPRTGGRHTQKRKALDEAYASQVFGFLTRLAQLLITADHVDEVLERVTEIAFEALPVDRGFVMLKDEDSGELVCGLVRVNERVELRPQGEVPISKTMLQAVMRERVALLTFDALSDRRLAGTESVRIHQIRAAMCAPLWSGEKIIGVVQLDSPHNTGTFTEQDVDLLTALANYCAVAIERLRNAEVAEFERQARNRLERYHSPAVIEAILQESRTGPEGREGLRAAEATVLFADLVGFTAFSELAPTEEVAELLEGFFTLAVEVIFSAGGTLDKFIGDCVMAFFGAPMAQADHAQRAVKAALRIRDALQTLNAERAHGGKRTITTRIGINSGPVVVGDIGSNRRVDYTVLGNTVNVAARLESSVAKAGDIVIGDQTHRLLGGAFATECLGEQLLKGLSQRVIAHRVVGE